MAQVPPIRPGLDDASALSGDDPELPGPSTPDIHPIADRLFRPGRLARLACLIGLSVLLPYLVQRLPNLSSRAEYRLETERIRVIPPPQRPVPDDLVEQIRLQNQLPRELSLLDSKLSRTLAEAFSRHPWIARVKSVKQSFPADVVVEVEFRHPVAMVQVKGGRVPIDGSGVILPSEDFTAGDVAQYPAIRRAGAANVDHVGDRVTEPGLVGAARLASVLAPRWKELELEWIELPGSRDSSADPADIVLQLRSKSGSTILWGRAPGTDHPGELTAAQKLARLEKYVTEFGGFDRPNGPYEIDIRHWQEITRRPSARPQVSSGTRRDSRRR